MTDRWPHIVLPAIKRRLQSGEYVDVSGFDEAEDGGLIMRDPARIGTDYLRARPAEANALGSTQRIEWVQVVYQLGIGGEQRAYFDTSTDLMTRARAHGWSIVWLR